MTFLAYVIAALCLIEILTQPFRIGYERVEFTAWEYIINLLYFVAVIILCWFVISN